MARDEDRRIAVSAMGCCILVLLCLLGMAGAAISDDSSLRLGPFPHELNWTNSDGGPLLPRGDPISLLTRPSGTPPSPAPMIIGEPREEALSSAAPSAAAAAADTSYSYQPGFLEDGNDLATIQVDSLQAACDACTAAQLCRSFTYNNSAGGVNGTFSTKTTVFLKKIGPCEGRRGACTVTGGAPWATWHKTGLKSGPPATVLKAGGLAAALRADTFTVQWLNLSAGDHTNFSFVPALSDGSALPLVHHLGDITIRARTAGSSSSPYDYYSSSFGPGAAVAVPVTKLRPGELAAHDITPLLAATNLAGLGDGDDDDNDGKSSSSAPPVTVRRAYLDVAGSLGIAFEVTNPAPAAAGAGAAVEIGALGMSVPAAVSQDAHIGGDHGWVEWLRVHVNDALQLDESCIVAVPLGGGRHGEEERGDEAATASPTPTPAATPAATPTTGGGFEAYRPILEFGGGGYEFTAHSRAWADEWQRNQQWPFLYMDYQLNKTGIWPEPRSPWPSWGDGGQTVRTNTTDASQWNPPTSRVLQPGETATYGVKLQACPGGTRTRDQALMAAGEPVLRTVPGTTLPTDLQDGGRVFVTMPPGGLKVTGASSSDPAVLKAGTPTARGALRGGVIAVPVVPVSPGRARIEIGFSDGTTAVAHYLVLPPLPQQVKSVATHWSEVAWLPRDYPDPFGRSAAVLPYDREDGRRRLNDARAYDVGLSDDAGAANNLGLATSQAYAPFQSAVSRLDEYVASTMLGVKNDTAKPPLRSLQVSRRGVDEEMWRS